MPSNGQVKDSRSSKALTTVKSFDENHQDQGDNSVQQYLREKTQEAIAICEAFEHRYYKIAKIAIEVKELVPHGNYEEWIKTDLLKNVRFSYPTLQRWVRVVQTFGKEFKLFENSLIDSFQDYALYSLSAKEVPYLARQEAIAKASKGEKITSEIAKTIAKGYVELKFEPKSDLDRPKPEIIAVRQTKAAETQQSIKEDSWHQLGRHQLYCGYPNAPQFKKKLPKNVSAIFAFAPTPDWQLSSPCQAKSINVVYSDYEEDFDYEPIFGAFLNVATESNDVLVCCYFPVPECLAIAHDLGLICYIAEPNVERCQKIIDVWNNN